MRNSRFSQRLRSIVFVLAYVLLLIKAATAVAFSHFESDLLNLSIYGIGLLILGLMALRDRKTDNN